MWSKYLSSRTMAWWLAILAVAFALKYHYSVATVEQLEWMLWPLSLLLEWTSGHTFQRNSLNEWASATANIRLAKGCAGINFLIMSLLAWGYIFRPDPSERTELKTWLAGRVILLAAIIIAAWITSLVANNVRILLALSLPGGDADLHRSIGLFVYLPLLWLQLFIGTRGDLATALFGPLLLYAMIMVMAPLVTGNAFNHTTLFLKHLLVLLLITVLVSVIYLYHRIRLSKPVPCSILEVSGEEFCLVKWPEHTRLSKARDRNNHLAAVMKRKRPVWSRPFIPFKPGG